MKRAKPKPLHQLATDKALTQKDAHELQLFRDFLRQKGSRTAAYKRIYEKEQKP